MDGTESGSAVADASGNWAFRPTAPLSDGLHRLAARAGDTAGNLSPLSGLLSISVDTLPPTIPVIQSPQEVRIPTPLLSGTAEPRSVVAIWVDGQLRGSMEAGATGAWTFPITQPLADALYAIQVSAKDPAGNVSLKGDVFQLRVDTSLLDADGNGLADAWERTYFPERPPLPQEDADGDGTTNLMEYLSGTDPRNRESRFSPIGTQAETLYTMPIPTVRGRVYKVWVSSNLKAWHLQETIQGDGSLKIFHFEETTIPTGILHPPRHPFHFYFKIEVVLQ
jgi:hypothetical protein